MRFPSCLISVFNNNTHWSSDVVNQCFIFTVEKMRPNQVLCAIYEVSKLTCSWMVVQILTICALCLICVSLWLHTICWTFENCPHSQGYQPKPVSLFRSSYTFNKLACALFFFFLFRHCLWYFDNYDEIVVQHDV